MAEPVRLRGALKLAKSAGSACWPGTMTQEGVGAFAASMGAAIPVLTPQILLAEAQAGFAHRLQIMGELSDLLPLAMEVPAIEAMALAPRCRLAPSRRRTRSTGR